MFNRKAKIIVSDKTISDLRMNFKIGKSLIGYPNLGNIKIYNLSKSSRDLLGEEGLSIELFAGYEDVAVPLIFKGDIVNVVHWKYGPDWISEIFASDGYNILKQSVINKTLPAGTTTAQIYDELIDKMSGVSKGITEGLSSCLSGKKSLLRSLQLSGNVKDWLDKISNDCGFEYSINDGVIEATPTGEPWSDESPVVINQNSGMIGSPERTEIGVNVKNLLLPSVKLGRTIRIESISTSINIGNQFFREVPPIDNEGVYRIDKIVHSGDTHANLWQSHIFGRNF